MGPTLSCRSNWSRGVEPQAGGTDRRSRETELRSLPRQGKRRLFRFDSLSREGSEILERQSALKTSQLKILKTSFQEVEYGVVVSGLADAERERE